LPVLNGNGRWALPLPATYVVGRDGVIQFAHIESDYRMRAEPTDVLHALRKIGISKYPLYAQYCFQTSLKSVRF